MFVNNYFFGDYISIHIDLLLMVLSADINIKIICNF